MKTAVMPKIEYRSYPVELEQRNAKITQLEGLVATAKTEKRSLSSAEQTQFNAIKKEIEQIDLKLAEDSVNDLTNSKIETRGLSQQEQKEIRSFIRYIQSGGTDLRDLSSTGSGAIVPKTIADRVISRVREIAPVFGLMQQYSVQGALSVPVYDWTAHTSTGFASDLTQITNSSGTFLTTDLKAFPIVSLSLVGRSLINQSSLDVMNIIVEQIAMSIANFISAELINDTNGKFSGVLNDITNTVSAETAGEVGLDDLINIQMSVASVFQPNSYYLMHPNILKSIRKLKDTSGQPLLIAGNENLKNSFGYTLLGSSILLDENMPATITAGSKFMYYGSFQDGLIGNTQPNAPLSTQILTERYADIYGVGILSSMEFDCNLGNSRALGCLVGI